MNEHGERGPVLVRRVPWQSGEAFRPVRAEEAVVVSRADGGPLRGALARRYANSLCGARERLGAAQPGPQGKTAALDGAGGPGSLLFPVYAAGALA